MISRSRSRPNNDLQIKVHWEEQWLAGQGQGQGQTMICKSKVHWEEQWLADQGQGQGQTMICKSRCDEKNYDFSTCRAWCIPLPKGLWQTNCHLGKWKNLYTSSSDVSWVWTWLIHWGRDNKATIYQTTFSNAFSWMKMYKFRLRFHWSLFPMVQLMILQYCTEPKGVSSLMYICHSASMSS